MSGVWIALHSKRREWAKDSNTHSHKSLMNYSIIYFLSFTAVLCPFTVFSAPLVRLRLKCFVHIGQLIIHGFFFCFFVALYYSYSLIRSLSQLTKCCCNMNFTKSQRFWCACVFVCVRVCVCVCLCVSRHCKFRRYIQLYTFFVHIKYMWKQRIKTMQRMFKRQIGK